MGYEEIVKDGNENVILMKNNYAHLYRSEESNCEGKLTRIIRKRFDLQKHTFTCLNKEKESMLLKNEVTVTIFEYEAN